MRPVRLPSGPTGRLYAATLVVSVGGGAWWTCWALFAIRSVGLTTTEFGLGITVAGLIGLVVGSPLGYIADRIGTRETLVGIGLVQGAAILAYAGVHSFWPFFAVACVAVTAERSGPGIRIAVISGLTSGPDRLHQISVNRVVSHVGVAAGSAFGGLVLYLDSRAGYLALIVLHGCACLGAALIVLGVPHVPSLADRKTKRKMLVLRDRPFLLIVGLSALLALNWAMLGTAVPLWVSTHTAAPVWVVGVMTAGNAVAVALFQVRVSRVGASIPGAARLGKYCGVVLAASCLLFAATLHGSGAWVVVLLLVAAGLHAVGELLYVASGWGLSVGLAPDDAHGEYQGMFSAGPAAALMLAPVLMTTLVVGWGVAGWGALAVLFLLGGLPTGPASRWALRTEHRRRPVAPAAAG
jgi:MFS family permease